MKGVDSKLADTLLNELLEKDTKVSWNDIGNIMGTYCMQWSMGSMGSIWSMYKSMLFLPLLSHWAFGLGGNKAPPPLRKLPLN